MTNLGFKKLTLENWLEPDEISSYFISISLIDGITKPIDGNYWVHYILEPKLKKTVPIEIRKLFEVARGAIAYGYFFYPLYTLAYEQLFRVAEAAVSHKCKAIGAPYSISTFNKKVNYLMDKNVISQQDKIIWNATRKLRNFASHPTFQTIIPPGSVITTLEHIADKINSLFINPE